MRHERLRQRAREVAEEQFNSAKEAAAELADQLKTQVGGERRDPSADFETVIGGGPPPVEENIATPAGDGTFDVRVEIETTGERWMDSGGVVAQRLGARSTGRREGRRARQEAQWRDSHARAPSGISAPRSRPGRKG